MADYKSTHTGEQIDTAIDNANSNWSLLMANLGIGRWRSISMVYPSYENSKIIYDDLAKYYSNVYYIFSFSEIVNENGGQDNWKNIIFSNPTTFFGDRTLSFNYSFCSFKNECPILLPTMKGSFYRTFKSSKFTKILVADNCVVQPTSLNGAFDGCSNLTEIGAFDCSNCTDFAYAFQAGKLKSIHIKHFKYSFNISTSTAFEEADLVEIISNLDAVTTTQTLTMGATNLAKLTDAEKKVATDKGWVLA